MQPDFIRLVPILVLLSCASLLQACGTATPMDNDALMALESPGLLTVKPYTRTIFSSSNF